MAQSSPTRRPEATKLRLEVDPELLDTGESPSRDPIASTASENETCSVLYCAGRRTRARQTSALTRLDASGNECDVVVCSNGARAWELLQNVGFDAVVVEHDLDGMSGLDLLALASATRVEPPIIFVSHDASVDLAQQAVNLGAEALVFCGDGEDSAAALVPQLDRVLKRRELVRENEQLVDSLRSENVRLAAEADEHAQELDRAGERLRSLDKLKGDFIALLSREFRGPVASIMTYAELLELTDGSDREERVRIARGVLGATERLSTFADDCDEFSRWYSGDQPLSLGPCQVEEVVAAAVDRVRPGARERSVRVEAGTLLPARLRADGEVLADALARLLSRAVHSVAPHSVVRVTGSVGADYSLEISAPGWEIEADLLDVSPSNSGVVNDSRRELQGLDLGLALVGLAVDAHDGTIEVESSVDRTLVRLRLSARGSQAVRRVRH